MAIAAAVVMLAAMVPAVLAGGARAERVALVIGNSAYQHGAPLANPSNDATDMANALRAVGFKVILGRDLDWRAFNETVRAFSNALRDGDDAVFYYAGHGLQVRGQNYLIPVDAKLDSERDLDFSAVRLDVILRQMEIDREGKTNIVILDACRDNPLARNLSRSMGTRSSAVGVGLAQVESGVGTFIAFSTQPGNVALDGEGRNSPFTAALVKRVNTPGRTLSALMIDVRKDVLARTKGRQVPWDHSALTGDFYFARGEPAERGGGQMTTISPETLVRIAQLRERIHRLREEDRDIQQAIFDHHRDRMSERDRKVLERMQRDFMRLTMRRSEKIRQRLRLEQELEGLEKAANLDGAR
jgi:hypothetical protein